MPPPASFAVTAPFAAACFSSAAYAPGNGYVATVRYGFPLPTATPAGR